MKNLIAAFLSFLSLSVYPASMEMPILEVTDGDTIKSFVNLPCPLCLVSIRIIGIDTPEKTWRGKCDKERELGEKATEFVKNIVGKNKVMTVHNVKWDKYGGRIDGDVEVDGRDISKALIAAGLAQPYTGQGDKPEWCR